MHGDVTDDQVLLAAGIDRARALIAALDTDAENVYVTLSSRALRPDLVIVARARTESSKAKLLRAGADRAVNPQLIGGRRMAAFALQPHVAEFLDVVMHDETLDYRIEEFEIAPNSHLLGCSLHEAAIRQTTGALLLALAAPGGRSSPTHRRTRPSKPTPSSSLSARRSSSTRATTHWRHIIAEGEEQASSVTGRGHSTRPCTSANS